jgi:DNA-binding HxlR family transcriptional regulator/putative sterol carrier protein
MSPRRSYDQYCSAARALDTVGDRWTLLIVRELMPGPRRFTDLVDGLPGISRNLLTERLRNLERDGLVLRQELPPPAARQVYELTQDGRDLGHAMAPLGAWAIRRMGERAPGELFSARWPAVPMLGLADRGAAAGVREAYQYLVGDTAFYFAVDDGAIELHDGRADEPAVVVTTDEKTWARVVTGSVRAADAMAAGSYRVEGDREAVARMRRIFSRSHMLAQGRAPG